MPGQTRVGMGCIDDRHGEKKEMACIRACFCITLFWLFWGRARREDVVRYSIFWIRWFTTLLYFLATT
jgi:hypothetical protein